MSLKTKPLKTTIYMLTAMCAMLTTAIGSMQTNAIAAEVAQIETIASGDFVNKRYKVAGGWSVEARDDGTYIVFDDAFKTKGGPDLKIFLSPQVVAETNGRNATDGAVFVGELKSTRGSQEYRIPDDVVLSDFSSILIHCEAYSVLWGGGDL